MATSKLDKSTNERIVAWWFVNKLKPKMEKTSRTMIEVRQKLPPEFWLLFANLIRTGKINTKQAESIFDHFFENGFTT